MLKAPRHDRRRSVGRLTPGRVERQDSPYPYPGPPSPSDTSDGHSFALYVRGLRVPSIRPQPDPAPVPNAVTSHCSPSERRRALHSQPLNRTDCCSVSRFCRVPRCGQPICPRTRRGTQAHRQIGAKCLLDRHIQPGGQSLVAYPTALQSESHTPRTVYRSRSGWAYDVNGSATGHPSSSPRRRRSHVRPQRCADGPPISW